MSDEFDDVKRNGPFADSKKARDEIARLKHEYGLSFTHNPGGGEFNGNGIHCQVSMQNDLEDLAALRKAVASRRDYRPDELPRYLSEADERKIYEYLREKYKDSL